MVNKFKLTVEYSDKIEKITYPETFVKAMKELHDEKVRCDCGASDVFISCEENGTMRGIFDGSEDFISFTLEEIPF